MVIWFNNNIARQFLLNNTFVYTLRPKKRREGKEPLFWHKFMKRGNVFVKFMKEINNANELIPFVNMSGFNNINDWYKEAKNSKFLYFVSLLNIDESLL